MKKFLFYSSWFLIIIGIIVLVYFIRKAICSGFHIWGKENIDFTTTGQFGDFVGGVVGTIFALAGTFLIILTFQEQAKQNQDQANQNREQSFESKFFEMIRLHRENVSDQRFTHYDFNSNDFVTAENRKVFRIIFRDFLDCFKEVKKFSELININDIILPKYQKRLKKIIKNNNSKIDLLELSFIDIAYSIVFYGSGKEGILIITDRFKSRYLEAYFSKLLTYIKIKPKKENSERWRNWKILNEFENTKFHLTIEDWYNYTIKNPIGSIPSDGRDNENKEFSRYYGGHQHRLGHYFRHLFQSYKYIHYNSFLTVKEKYSYGKILRAQISSYEQALIFVNSLSSLGMKWEYIPEESEEDSEKKLDKINLITNYQLIKNLPGYHLFELNYKTYYPNIKYETEEGNE